MNSSGLRLKKSEKLQENWGSEGNHRRKAVVFVTHKLAGRLHVNCDVVRYGREEILGCTVRERSVSLDQRWLVVLW